MSILKSELIEHPFIHAKIFGRFMSFVFHQKLYSVVNKTKAQQEELMFITMQLYHLNNLIKVFLRIVYLKYILFETLLSFLHC